MILHNIEIALNYLCTDNFEFSHPLTIISDSSSDEELPTLSTPTAKKQDETVPASYPIASSDDDTLPLVTEVIFHHGTNTIKESFPNNTQGSVSNLDEVYVSSFL